MWILKMGFLTDVTSTDYETRMVVVSRYLRGTQRCTHCSRSLILVWGPLNAKRDGGWSEEGWQKGLCTNLELTLMWTN